MNQKHIVFVAGEDEYRSEVTLPALAEEVTNTYGARTTVLTAAPDPTNPEQYPRVGGVGRGGLAVFYMRFRTLPANKGRPHRALSLGRQTGDRLAHEHPRVSLSLGPSARGLE